MIIKSIREMLKCDAHGAEKHIVFGIKKYIGMHKLLQI